MRLPISYVVIAHHNSQTLASCLDSVEADAAIHDELILVLNNPDPQTKSLTQHRDKWTVLFESSPGPQFARNRGANHSKNAILCFLDSDINIPIGWTELMLKNFADPWVAVGQSRIQQQKAPGFLNRIKRLQYLKSTTRFYFPKGSLRIPTLLILDTAAMMLKREWFLRVGGFDTAFTRLEDSDLTLRIMYAGGDIFFEDRALAVEINDLENLFQYLKKQYYSMKLMPLFLERHHIDYHFPFSVAPLRSAPRITTGIWDVVFKAVELIGVANSSHTLKMVATKYYAFKPNFKKMLFEEYSNPNIRTVWVGGKKREYDLFYREYLRSPG